MLRLIKVSFFLNIREVRNIALMVFLPILLTLILGVSLSSVFNENNSNVLAASKWLYQIEDTDSGETLREFLDTYHTQLNMEIAEQNDETVALSSVANLDVDGYLIYEGGIITLYKNEHSSESTKWLEIVFDNYLDRADIIEGIIEDNTVSSVEGGEGVEGAEGVEGGGEGAEDGEDAGTGVGAGAEGGGPGGEGGEASEGAAGETGIDFALLQFVQDTSMDVGSHIELLQIDSTRQPDAIGYYAIAMITLTSCYSLVVLILSLSEERRKNTLKRYLLSGKSFFSFLVSKSISICLVLLAELLIVMLFDALVYRVDFGDLRCWATILATTIIFAFVVTQFGVLLSLLFKNLTALTIVVNAVLLPVVLFFGGAYLHFYKLISMGLQNIIVFSPVYHLNRGLFDAIYLNSYGYIAQFAVIVCAVSLLMLLINMLLAKWRGNSWVQ